MANKVVNNGPCSTTRVGKVNGLDILVPSPSSFFVNFCNKAEAVVLDSGPSGADVKSL